MKKSQRIIEIMTRPRIITRYIVGTKERDLYHFDIVEAEGKLSYTTNIPKDVITLEIFSKHLSLLCSEELTEEQKDDVALLLFTKLDKLLEGQEFDFSDEMSFDDWRGTIKERWFFNFERAMLEARKYSPTI